MTAQQTEFAEHPCRAESRLVGGADQRHVVADDVTDHPAEEWVVSAPEEQGVDIGCVHRSEQSFGQHHHLVPRRLTALDELDEAGTRRAGEPDSTSRHHGGVFDSTNVGSRGHGADGADHGCPPAFSRFDERRRAGGDDIDDGHGELIAQLVETGRGSGVAGDDDRLDAVVGDETRRQLASEASHFRCRSRSVRIARRVADVDKILGRQQVDDGASDREPSEP